MIFARQQMRGEERLTRAQLHDQERRRRDVNCTSARNNDTDRSPVAATNGGAPTANHSAATISGTNTVLGNCGTNATTNAINSE